MARGEGQIGTVPSFEKLGLFLSVEGGREYLIRVPGTSQSMLGDEEVAALLNWMVAQFASEVPTNFEPYTQKEVGLLRSQRLFEVKEMRNELLGKVR